MVYGGYLIHFYHENIIKYCNRPFEDVNHMNLSLISNWNNLVKPDDDIIIAGDFIHSGEVCNFHPLKYDIGVDNNDFKPISYEEIKIIITKQILTNENARRIY